MYEIIRVLTVTVILTLYAIGGVSGKSGPESQVCGDSGFYCKANNQCAPRSERCVGMGTCFNLSTGIEDNCDCNGSYESCDVFLGRAKLSLSGFSSKKRED